MRDLSSLPLAMRDYASSVTGPSPARMILKQQGQMRMSPNGRWMDWVGDEVLECSRIGFSWQARFGFYPGVWLAIEDAYANGAGKLEGRLWGRVPLFSHAGPDAAIAQAMRYLAEIPWVPHAIVHNDALQWSGLKEGSVRVSSLVGGETVFVDFTLDTQGRPHAARTPARMKGTGKKAEKFPWGGVFSEYQDFGGVFLPKFGEVYWDLPEGRFTYWRGEVVSARAAAPFTPELGTSAVA